MVEKLKVIDSEKVVEARSGIPTVALMPFYKVTPLVTDQEQVEEVEVDFSKSNSPSLSSTLQ